VSLLPAVNLLAAVLLAPLLPGVINQTKAKFAGRRGSPLLQAYYDLWKLLRKGVVYSRTTTWVFRVAPAAGLACVLCALAVLPASGIGAIVHFPGDLVLLAYVLGLMRFFTVLAALDCGSSFEGMGASREVQFSALAEPALLLGLAALVRVTGVLSLTELFTGLGEGPWLSAGPALVLVAAALLVVMLAENCRIPVDDPNTHLELTMIHEVMVLDYGGPDLAFVLYAAAIKLWVLGALVVNVLLGAWPLTGWGAMAAFVAGMILLAMVVGIVESVMARLSLVKVPHLLVGAGALSVLAFILVVRFAS
jgi:formate hydrogenlyase subunit 4